MPFNTVLHLVSSPQNVGMITRSHVAFGGQKLIFVGYDRPWQYRSGTQGFSRKLEATCEVLHFETVAAFLSWSLAESISCIAVEITETAANLPGYPFPETCNLIVGSEKNGISEDLLAACHGIVTIPQFGPAACLNVAVAASIAMYEYTRACEGQVRNLIRGHKFDTPDAAGTW
ncbi:MAG: TrmH family RNA methyltransferase [Bacteroidia bacterium]|nr:TrmH family RNA methyltransferase [Bacteroidia bacterium]